IVGCSDFGVGSATPQKVWQMLRAGSVTSRVDERQRRTAFFSTPPMAKWPHVTVQPQPRHFLRSHERGRGSPLVDAQPAWWIAWCHRVLARGAAVKRLTLALAVVITAFTCHATAADLRAPVTAPLAPTGAAYDWSGFYAGVHAGGSWADNE